MLHRLILSTTLAFALSTPATAQEDLAGAYLAARLAGFASDYAEAVRYYDRLLAEDVSQPAIVESAMVVYAAVGDFEKAAAIADKAEALGANRQLASIVQLVETLRAGELATATNMLEGGTVTGPLLDGLLLGWSRAGQGDVSGALKAFQDLADEGSFDEFAHIHRAFALAMVGDFESADRILSGEAHGPLRLGPRGISIHAQVLAMLDRREDATTLLDTAIGRTNSADLIALKEQITTDNSPIYRGITSANQGMAEAFFTLAAVVSGEASDSYTLLHSRAAMALDPANVDAALLSADIFERLGQYQLAGEALDTVPRESPAYVDAEIARANVLFADGKSDAAIEVLKALTESHPDQAMVFASLGDTYRRTDQFEEARDAYAAAIDRSDMSQTRNWFLYYARGITNERTDRWPEAAADFRKALELRPDQPLVLNYFGYSLVEKRENLDEALDMIRRAVEARPNDGFITDSLGWVYYRLGRFEEAVEPMEKAVALEPLDPVINDHLGDVYWKVGRKREAEFQWKRALSFIPEPNDTEAEPDRIRRKLEVGLDVVLEAEGGVGVAAE